MWLATDEEWVLPCGVRGVPVRWVESTHHQPGMGLQEWRKWESRAAGSLCPERRPGRPDPRVRLRSCPVRHASPQGGPPSPPPPLPGGPGTGEPCGTHRAQGHRRHPPRVPFSERRSLPEGPRSRPVGECSQPGGPPAHPKLSLNAWGRARLQRRHRSSRACHAEVRPTWSPGLWGGVVPLEGPHA